MDQVTTPPPGPGHNTSPPGSDQTTTPPSPPPRIRPGYNTSPLPPPGLCTGGWYASYWNIMFAANSEISFPFHIVITLLVTFHSITATFWNPGIQIEYAGSIMIWDNSLLPICFTGSVTICSLFPFPFSSETPFTFIVYWASKVISLVNFIGPLALFKSNLPVDKLVPLFQFVP